MTDKIGVNKLATWKHWLGYNVLQEYCSFEDVDLLSINYRKAINGCGDPVSKIPHITFTDRGGQKGQWLNSELSIINCCI
jgi:hypothetical protein